MPSSTYSISIFKEYLKELEHVINMFCCQGKVIVMGDFNAHIGHSGGPRSFRHVNERGRLLAEVMSSLNLISVNSLALATGPLETYYANDGLSVTTVDHILIHEENIQFVTSCRVGSEQHSNLSYHLPVYCELNTMIILREDSCCYTARLSWKSVKDDKILSRYQEKVKKAVKLLMTTKLLFNSIEDIEKATSDITDALKQAAINSIPTTKFKPKLKPYWKTDLKYFHKESRRHRSIWVEAGRPRESDNAYFLNYKNAKREFRKALRRKAYEHEVKCFENDVCLFDMDRCNFQKIMSKKRKWHGNDKNELKVDGRIIRDENELLDVWKRHYEDLYTPKPNPMKNDVLKSFVKWKALKFEDYS